MTPSDLPTVVMMAMGSIDVWQIPGRDRRTITRRMQKELRKYGLRLTRGSRQTYIVEPYVLIDTYIAIQPTNYEYGTLVQCSRWALRYLERYHETQ